MKPVGELQEWLRWVIKIRFVIISFVFAVDFVVRQLAPGPANAYQISTLAIAVVFWYIVGLFYLIYNQISRDYWLQAQLQIYSDIVVITAIVRVTGDVSSNYTSLYLVVIILASVLLPRAQAFVVAAVCFVAMGAMLEVAYLPSLYPSVAQSMTFLRPLEVPMRPPVDLATLQVKIVASLFGFFAVAYLASYLSDRLRKTGEALRAKSGQVASLQAIKENIIQSMRGGLITTDLEGRIIEVNLAGAGILGRTPAEIRGQSILAVLPEGELSFSSPLEASGTLSRKEFRYRLSNGEERILGISASPLRVPEIGVVGCVYTFQDLTGEKRLEAEYRVKDRMAAIGRMASAIAHEIRNPLASIAGSVKVLNGIASLGEDETKLLSIVSHESERLNKLVSDFLQYAGGRRFELRQVDLVNVLEETLLLVGHHPLYSSRTRIERRFPRQPVWVAADADRIRQVFWNICDNALKAMPEGGTLTAEVVDGETVRVVLSDTGIGFTAAQLQKLFEPFASGFNGGTGLGLAIVHQVVEGHRGHIRAESEPGKGARFIIELPRRAPAPETATAASQLRLGPFRGRGE